MSLHDHRTVLGAQVYELKTQGIVPLSLADMKTYLKVTSTSDDALITTLLAAATSWGELYTAREFRVNTWLLFLNEFGTIDPSTGRPRIKINRIIRYIHHLRSRASGLLPIFCRRKPVFWERLTESIRGADGKQTRRVRATPAPPKENPGRV